VVKPHTPEALKCLLSGILAEQLAQIFEPLHTTKPEGTGLGLYMGNGKEQRKISDEAPNILIV
jgi:hypothetical protein